MDSMVEIFLNRANNEIMAAESLKRLSEEQKDKENFKRGHFTYETIPQANKEPATDSLNNSKFFVANISKVVKKK
jgi:hypothetical protein